MQRGDTLYKIANQYGVSVNDIIEFNQLTSTGLIIGQQLLIPTNNQTEESETITYTIKSGDSLWKISQSCNISINEIVNLNNLQTTVLQPGDTLLLPNTCNFDGNNNINNDTNNNSEYLRYIVTNNDTLYGIARKYGVTVAELVELNNLPTNLLVIGQELLIPTNNDYLNYYVQANDTLYSIARKFNTTVQDIRRLNNLTNDTLSINQLLLIPS